MKVDDVVTFNEKVFFGVYVPYYDAYKGHIFRVTGLFECRHISLVLSFRPVGHRSRPCP